MALKSLKNLSAFQGKGWKPRTKPLSAELAANGGIWAPFAVDSEFKRLEAVVLHCPGPEFRRIKSPNAVQHLGRIDVRKIRKEYAALAAAFKRSGVKVFMIPRPFDHGRWPEKWNLMYARDLFLNTREGAVVARMASLVRAGEEKYISAVLAGLGVPINKTVSGRGLFEGADALWLDRRTVLCGLGNRSNAEGLGQLREVLGAQGVKTIPVKLPRDAQHLLGIVQIVDSDLAFVRVEIAGKKIIGLLRRRGFGIVPVEETDEVTRRQGMNVVTLGPRRILMPKNCPRLKRLYERSGVSVAAELEIGELLQGGGGLGCATGILSRRA